MRFLSKNKAKEAFTFKLLTYTNTPKVVISVKTKRHPVSRMHYISCSISLEYGENIKKILSIPEDVAVFLIQSGFPYKIK